MKFWKNMYNDLDRNYLELVKKYTKLVAENQAMKAQKKVNIEPDRCDKAFCAECRNGVMIERRPYSDEPNSYTCVFDCACGNFCRK